MKPIIVSSRARTLTELLKKARRGTVILESPDGQRFALAPIDDWEAFDLGRTRSFAEEVERTGRNKQFMKALAARRRKDKGPGIPIDEARKQLGLD